MKTQDTPAGIGPAEFLEQKMKLGAQLSHARTDEEREAIKAELKTLSNRYRTWHLKTYGWAYAAY